MNNQKLYEKMLAEQQDYLQWLLSQPPSEILDHAWEYIVREKIVEAMENRDLTDRQASALLKTSTPLKDICEDVLKGKSSFMPDIWNAIECRAIRVIWQQRHRKTAER